MNVLEYRRVDGTGRIRLPLRFRRELGVEYGDELLVVLDVDGRGEKVLTIRPAPKAV